MKESRQGYNAYRSRAKPPLKGAGKATPITDDDKICIIVLNHPP